MAASIGAAASIECSTAGRRGLIDWSMISAGEEPITAAMEETEMLLDAERKQESVG